jgi:hypothetical protein
MQEQLQHQVTEHTPGVLSPPVDKFGWGPSARLGSAGGARRVDPALTQRSPLDNHGQSGFVLVSDDATMTTFSPESLAVWLSILVNIIKVLRSLTPKSVRALPQGRKRRPKGRGRRRRAGGRHRTR